MVEWKTLEGWMQYEVSNMGNVRKKGKQSPLKVSIDRTGYPKVRPCQNNKATTMLVHRLVAKAFVPNPDNKPQVNHEDGNKTNNVHTNLTWVTRSENCVHGWKIGLSKALKGEHAPRARLTQRQVDEIRHRWASGESQLELSHVFNMHSVTIHNIVREKRWVP